MTVNNLKIHGYGFIHFFFFYCTYFSADPLNLYTVKCNHICTRDRIRHQEEDAKTYNNTIKENIRVNNYFPFRLIRLINDPIYSSSGATKFKQPPHQQVSFYWPVISLIYMCFYFRYYLNLRVCRGQSASMPL